MSTPGEFNFTIWRGDTTPPVIWTIDADLTGATVSLEVARDLYGCRETRTFIDGDGLTVTPGTTSTVEWAYSTEDSNWIPVGFNSTYRLRQDDAGYILTRYYGTIIGR